jgi:NTP pyrophosphatase (non-canonical NTP hydrolase)
MDQKLAHAIDTLNLADVRRAAIIDLIDGISTFQATCHMLSKKSGWWEGVNPKDPFVFGTKLALVHSEVSEALEGGRKGKMDDHLPHRLSEEVELADAMIRIADLAAARNLDLAGAILEKLAYNQKRPDHKPANRAAEGGKKF